MGKLIKKIKIKKQDGTFTDYIPIGAEAKNIETNDGDSVQNKLNKKPYYYNTVADMKADIKLKDGDMVITLGYYSAEDGGGANYKITSEESETEYQEELENGLYSTLTGPNIKFSQIGGINNNSTDNLSLFNTFFSKKYKNYIVDNGTYYVSRTINLVNSNCNIIFENAQIKMIPTDSNVYYIFKCNKLHDITFKNLHLIGDRYEHLSDTGEWGHCLNITESYNIKVLNSTFENGWGDGIYIGLNYYEVPEIEVNNIIIENCKILNCSRNGISTCTGKNIIIRNCYIEGIDRTQPKSGIDIEPEHNDSQYPYLENLIIDNLIIKDCVYGITLGNGYPITVDITNCEFYNCNYGLKLTRCNPSEDAVVNISNILCKNIKNYGIYIKNINSNSYMNIDKVTIYNSTNDSTVDLNCGILIDCQSYDVYNIKLSNVTVNSGNIPFAGALFVYARNQYKLLNSNISNISSPYSIFINNPSDTTKYNVYKEQISNYYTLSTGGYNRLINRYIITQPNANTTRKFSKPLPDGEYTVEYYIKNNYGIYVDLTEFDNIYDESTTPLTNKKFQGIGESGIIKFRIINQDIYIITKVGNWANVS